MTSDSLSTFERRFNDWRATHQPIDFFGKYDTIFLSDQINNIISAQFEAADQIVASQKDIAEGIDRVALGIDRVTKRLEDIQETFTWGFTELIWCIEQTNEKLREILQVLQAPLNTQAKELKKRGEDAYRNGWFDDALKDFLESEEKNRYDFTIHHYLGNIYLFHKNNPTKGLEYYDKGVKYAMPKSPFHASFSLIHVGLIYYLQEKYQKAYEATLQAIKVSSNFYEAHYQHAQYCALLGKIDEATRHLRLAIVEGGLYFCIKAFSEEDFNGMKKQLIDLLKELRYNAYTEARSEIKEIKKLIREVKSYGVPNKFIGSTEEELHYVEKYLKRNSYLGCLKAIRKAKEVQASIVDNSTKHLEEIISRSEKKLMKLKRKSEPSSRYIIKISWIILAVLLLIPLYFLAQLFTYLIGPSYAWTVASLIYMTIIIMIPKISDRITRRCYSPIIKDEIDKINTLKKNLSACKQLYASISPEGLQEGEFEIFNFEKIFGSVPK